MTRAYVLDPTTRDILGLVDQSWEKLKYTRRYFGMDTFEMTIQRSRLWASTIEVGRLLYLPDEGDRIFEIEQVQSVAEGSTRNDLMTVAGRSLEGIAMADRLVIPAAGQAYDRQTATPAETAIKHYVTDHASSSALVVNRRVLSLTVIASGGAGVNVTVAGRYQTVFDIVKQIGLLAGIGWEILYNPTLDRFEFDIINGVDRSASVFFDFAFETLERWEELRSLVDSKNLAVVAGQGEGEEREIVTRYSGAEPTGFSRREVFLDARDIALGATTELQARGDAYLAAAKGETRLEAGIHQYGSFRYGTHWDMGDLVLIRNEERGISYTARIVEVEKAFDVSAAAPVVTCVIDRPFPTMKEQVNGAGAAPGMVDYPNVLNLNPDTIVLDRLNSDVRLRRDSTKSLTLDDNTTNGPALFKTQGEVWIRRSAGTTAFAIDPDPTRTSLFTFLITTSGEHQWGTGGVSRDVTLSRVAAGALKISSLTAADDALYIGDDAIFFDVDIADMIGIKGQQTATNGGIVFGSGKDTNLYRVASNKLMTDDSFVIGGSLWVGGTGAGQTGDGLAVDGSGNIEMRNANPFIDFKTSDIDFGARIIYDFNIADGLEFVGAAEYKFDNLVTIAGNLVPSSFLGSTVSSGSTTTFTISGGGTATFSSKSAEWVKIGRMVIARLNFSVTANGSGTAGVTITGTTMPIPVNTHMAAGDRGGTGVTFIGGRCSSDGSALQFANIRDLDAGTNVTGADLASGAGYSFNWAYMAST